MSQPPSPLVSQQVTQNSQPTPPLSQSTPLASQTYSTMDPTWMDNAKALIVRTPSPGFEVPRSPDTPSGSPTTLVDTLVSPVVLTPSSVSVPTSLIVISPSDLFARVASASPNYVPVSPAEYTPGI